MGNTNKTVHTCNFCGTHFTEDYLVKHNISIIPSLVDKNIKICGKCIDKCVKAIEAYRKTEEDAKKEVKEVVNKKHIIDKPSTISNSLSQWIIGQDKAKKDISTGVYNHYKLIASKNMNNLEAEIEKSNILLIGPTGTGKTAIVKALGKKLKVPYTIVDANSFTQAG